jgi:hypothetical protein
MALDIDTYYEECECKGWLRVLDIWLKESK